MINKRAFIFLKYTHCYSYTKFGTFFIGHPVFFILIFNITDFKQSTELLKI